MSGTKWDSNRPLLQSDHAGRARRAKNVRTGSGDRASGGGGLRRAAAENEPDHKGNHAVEAVGHKPDIPDCNPMSVPSLL